LNYSYITKNKSRSLFNIVCLYIARESIYSGVGNLHELNLYHYRSRVFIYLLETNDRILQNLY